MGIPAACATDAASSIAVICGTPTPATIRVVQIEPGPTPTFTPSAPASMSARAPSRVAIFPPTISTSNAFLRRATMSNTACECPCAVSTMRKSTPAATNAVARVNESSPTPIAAPTINLPSASLEACGYLSIFTKSLTVNKPRSFPSASTSGSFSTFLAAKRLSASSGATPTGAVTRGIGVITSLTGRAMLSSNRMSRLVTIPIKVPSGLTTGTPLMR